VRAHKEDFRHIGTNKKINILDFDAFLKIKKIQQLQSIRRFKLWLSPTFY